MGRTRIELTNSSAEALTVWMEPWAEELTMAPNQSLVFQCDSEVEDPVSVEYSPEGLAVFGTRKSTMKAFDGDRMIWECYTKLD